MEIAKATTQSTQINCAIKASNEFAKNLHRDGLDRGCIQHLMTLCNVASGGTRLYDSMVNVIKTFHSNGDRSRPWILVVVTDGDDNNSSLSFKKF
ncbi:unnamed protein product [Rhizophagus irregularis]|uniref:VWFA domain-containing protein n=1 Tax=Rhizophagus irregularis TaxID=588596 RepID=A0A2I1G1S6_9GLOM|nr:hypothetical protein RhiirA4_453999 [Rhizophagus irregularis]CAB4445580.1 unnamed protein product [Rhizophagus irregularis]